MIPDNYRWLMGGLAVVAAFLLGQTDVQLIPIIKVLLGAFLAFCAYANPATIGASLSTRLRPKR